MQVKYCGLFGMKPALEHRLCLSCIAKVYRNKCVSTLSLCPFNILFAVVNEYDFFYLRVFMQKCMRKFFEEVVRILWIPWCKKDVLAI